jgi:hypothetical protein
LSLPGSRRFSVAYYQKRPAKLAKNLGKTGLDGGNGSFGSVKRRNCLKIGLFEVDSIIPRFE